MYLMRSDIMSEWINVKDKLPDKQDCYLTYYNTNDYCIIDISGWDMKKQMFVYLDPEYYGDENENITHWMPLPEPPKEDKTT